MGTFLTSPRGDIIKEFQQREVQRAASLTTLLVHWPEKLSVHLESEYLR
jgi:hypothetical protein